MMIRESFVLVLGFLLTSTPGSQQLRHEVIQVQAGQMVALQCLSDMDHHGDSKVVWTSSTDPGVDLTNTSWAERMGVLVGGRSLVVLSAAVTHEGNYSCALGNSSHQSWFTLTVNMAQFRGQDQFYDQTCVAQGSCQLNCPEVNIPAGNNITRGGIAWHKEKEEIPTKGYFQIAAESHGGVYVCTRLYLYQGHKYNMTFTVKLQVKPKKKKETALILKPQDKEVFYVDLGSRTQIECEAVATSDFDKLFWLGQKWSAKNTKKERIGEKIKITTFLVFEKVTEEDLSKNYTCKLQSVSQTSRLVTVTLQKARRFYMPLVLSTVGVLLVTAAAVFIYVKLKIEITLFLRDTLGCSRHASDGKSYDAFLMGYKSNEDAGLDAEDMKCLASVLEERFGYSLCLHDRDISPGESAAQAVMDCVEESRTVVLVPISSDPDLESGLCSAVHEALVERQTRLILITCETTETGSLPEALRLLSKATNRVAWKGSSATSAASSSFWKQLRYHLPAPQTTAHVKLLPQSV